MLLDAVLELIVGIMLDASGGNGGAPGREVGEFELPNGQDLDSLVADGAHIDLPALDILLGDRIGVDALVDKGYTFLQFFRGVHNGCLRDAEGRLLGKALDDQRETQSPGRAGPVATRKNRKGRHADPMVGHKLLRQRLSPGKDQSPRVAAGVAYPEEFQEADHVLIKFSDAMEFFEEVEHDLRFPVSHGRANRHQLILNTEDLHLMAEPAQRRDDVVFGLDGVRLFLTQAI